MTFGKTARANSGGIGHPRGLHGSKYILPKDLLLSTYTSLPRSYLTQALIDIATVTVWALLGCAAVLIVGGPLLALGWILFFG